MSARKGCGFQGSKLLGRHSTHKNLAWFREVSESGDFFLWQGWYGRVLKYVSAVNQRKDNIWGWLTSVWLCTWIEGKMSASPQPLLAALKCLVSLVSHLCYVFRSCCFWDMLGPVAFRVYQYHHFRVCPGLHQQKKKSASRFSCSVYTLGCTVRWGCSKALLRAQYSTAPLGTNGLSNRRGHSPPRLSQKGTNVSVWVSPHDMLFTLWMVKTLVHTAETTANIRAVLVQISVCKARQKRHPESKGSSCKANFFRSDD